MHRAFRIAWLAVAATSLAGLTGKPAATAQEVRAHTETCTLQAGPTRSVVRVIDSETVLLDDHQEVRLIGALAPRSPDFSPSAEPWPPGEAAIAALKALVQGRSVSIAASGRARDRYGRQLAHLFVEDGSERVWVQGEMLSAGHARAYGLPGGYACMRELMAHERVARDEAAGLWASAAYAVRSARATRNLLRRRNSYEIVAGTVAKVAVTKARTYVNFGSDWRRDFTAGIEARVLRAHPELEQMLTGLEGRRVEVRGWIQYRNGPYVDIEDPSQIAIAGERLPGRTPAPPAAATSGDRDTQPPAEKEKRPAPSAPGALDL